MNLFTELKRRNVFKVGIAYAVVGWVLAQGASIFLPNFGAPAWVMPVFLGVMIAGFPIAVVFAWAFEMTPEGVKRSDAAPTKVKTATDPEVKTLVALSTAPSIAVLPFVDMSPAKDQEYFSDGLSEELLNRLVAFKGLRVIGRTSSFAFKGKNEDLRIIGETLGVNHILEGSVRKSGDHLRITAQLINPADGSHLWSKTYDRTLVDIFAIQDEISRAVADSLAVTMGVAAGERESFTRSIEAYEAYLLGLPYIRKMTAENIARGIEHLRRSVEIDPKFGAAWARLAEGYALGSQTGSSKAEEWRQKSAQANERLQAVAPNSVVAAITGARAGANRREWSEAERTLKRVQTPDSVADIAWITEYGRFVLSVGRVREAVGYLESARLADPLSPLVALFLCEAYADSGDIGAAFEESDRGRTLEGMQPLLAGTALLVALGTGDREIIETRAHTIADTDPATGALNSEMARLVGDEQALRLALRSAWSDPANQFGFRALAIAHWAAFAGDSDLALDALRRQMTLLTVYALWRPVMRDVRRHPDTKGLLRDLGLVDYWRESGKWGDFCRPVGDDDFECE
jgi:TolB-like protein